MAKYTRELRSIVDNTEIKLFPPNTLPEFEQFQEKFINTYYFREIGVAPTEKWLYMLQARFMLLLPYYEQRYNTVNYDIELFINENVTEIEQSLQNNLHKRKKSTETENQNSATNNTASYLKKDGTVDFEGNVKGEGTNTANEDYTANQKSTDTTNISKDISKHSKENEEQDSTGNSKTTGQSNEGVTTGGSSDKNTKENATSSSNETKRFSDTPQTDVLNSTTYAGRYETDYTAVNASASSNKNTDENMKMNEQKDTDKNSTDNTDTHSTTNTGKDSQVNEEHGEDKKENGTVDNTSNKNYNSKEIENQDSKNNTTSFEKNQALNTSNAYAQWEEWQKYKESNASQKNNDATKIIKGLRGVLPDDVISKHLNNIYNVHEEFINELSILFMGVY